MNKRDKYEQRGFELLIACGIPAALIHQPDKAQTVTRPEPDFLIPDCGIAIEVKHFEDDDLTRTDMKLSESLRSGQVISYAIPIKNDAFEEHLSSASKKFQNYPNYSTLLMVDLIDSSFLNPTAEFLIAGIPTIYLSRETGDVTGYLNKNRHIRINKNTAVGAVLFRSREGNQMFHNLMADKDRRMPFYFWTSKLKRVEFEQFAYMAPPSQPSQIFRLQSI